MGIIGPEGGQFVNPGKFPGPFERNPFPIQLFDVLPIFPAFGNPLEIERFNITPDKFGQAFKDCDEFENRTLLPIETRTIPFGEYVSEKQVTNFNQDTRSMCADQNLLQVVTGVKQNLYAISQDTQDGTGTDGHILGIKNQLPEDKIKDFGFCPLTKNVLTEIVSMVTFANNLCNVIIGNFLARKAILDALFNEGITPDMTHITVCCPDGMKREVQVLKYLGARFVLVDTWDYQQVLAFPFGTKTEKDKAKKEWEKHHPGEPMPDPHCGDIIVFPIGPRFRAHSTEIVRRMNLGEMFATDLAVVSPGWGGAAYFTPSNLGRQIHIVRETQKEKRTHVVKAVYTPIAFAIMTECAGAYLMNFIPPGPEDGGIIINGNAAAGSGRLVTAKFTRPVTPTP